MEPENMLHNTYFFLTPILTKKITLPIKIKVSQAFLLIVDASNRSKTKVMTLLPRKLYLPPSKRIRQKDVNNPKLRALLNIPLNLKAIPSSLV
jgi:hypothetical protein